MPRARYRSDLGMLISAMTADDQAADARLPRARRVSNLRRAVGAAPTPGRDGKIKECGRLPARGTTDHDVHDEARPKTATARRWGPTTISPSLRGRSIDIPIT